MTYLSVHRTRLVPALAMLLIALGLGPAYGSQAPGSRDTGKPAPTPTPTPKKTNVTTPPPGPKNSGSNKSVTAPVRTAQMTIITPPGCRIWLNEVPVETSVLNEISLSIDGQKVKSSERIAGLITLKGIRPGTYQLVVRKPDFREYTAPVTVTLDTENVFTVRLTPNPGTLTVSPSVGRAEVEIVNLDTNVTVGRYQERVNEFELAPGQYRVVTSRAGYRAATREIRVKPGESVYLEPLLEPLPLPTPTPKPAPLAMPMSFNVQRQEKYLFFYLKGSSGDSAQTLGSITVSLNGPASNTVTGNLNGLPCQIEVIKLENIAEASVVEAPGPGNNWNSIVVRVRPKDEKRRPISFAINWRSLANSPALKVEASPTGVVPAQAVRRVQPEYPLMARGSNAGGSVFVQVTIDKQGSVVATKVVEGPDVFRRAAEDAARKWKFRPATRDGQAVESEQILQFRFAP